MRAKVYSDETISGRYDSLLRTIPLLRASGNCPNCTDLANICLAYGWTIVGAIRSPRVSAEDSWLGRALRDRKVRCSVKPTTRSRRGGRYQGPTPDGAEPAALLRSQIGSQCTLERFSPPVSSKEYPSARCTVPNLDKPRVGRRNWLGRNPLVSGPLRYEVFADVMQGSAFSCDTTTNGIWFFEPRRQVSYPGRLSASIHAGSCMPTSQNLPAC